MEGHRAEAGETAGDLGQLREEQKEGARRMRALGFLGRGWVSQDATVPVAMCCGEWETLKLSRGKDWELVTQRPQVGQAGSGTHP